MSFVPILQTRRLKNWEIEKLNRSEAYNDVSVVYLATWLVNDMSGLVLVLISSISHYSILSTGAQGSHFDHCLRKVDSTPVNGCIIGHLSPNCRRKSSRFVSNPGISSPTMDRCHNSTLRIDDFTALRRLWRRCSVWSINYRQPIEDTWLPFVYRVWPSHSAPSITTRCYSGLNSALSSVASYSTGSAMDISVGLFVHVVLSDSSLCVCNQ